MFYNHTEKRYNQYSRYLLHKFSAKVYKLTLDAGFGCPNRDGLISSGGCIFCDDGGSFSRSQSNLLPIEEQLTSTMGFMKKRFKAEKFLAYFQAYSNTYAPVEKLKEVYDKSFSHPDVLGMSIGTRPDCVDEEKINLIAEYAKNNYVCIEYGLQTIHDKTLTFINRGHDFQCFLDAFNLTKNKNIKICVHVILGLPDETRKDMFETAKTIAKLGVDGVKIHALCAMKGTKLAEMYENKEFTPMKEDEYVDVACDFLELLPPKTKIHRLAGNGHEKLLVAPKWLLSKHSTLNKIDRELERRDSWQGKLFSDTEVFKNMV